MPFTPESIVEIKPKVGGQKMDFDGVSLSVGADAWGKVDYSMPEAYHFQGALLSWGDCALGDYGWVCLTHPATGGNLGAEAASGQANVTVATGTGAYFDPVNGASYLEVWDSSGNLKEVRKIASVSGDVVALDSNLQGTYDTTHKAIARLDGHSPVRGTHGLDAGIRLFGTSHYQIDNALDITNPIPAGLTLSIRVRTTADAGTRKVAVSFIFRKLAET